MEACGHRGHLAEHASVGPWTGVAPAMRLSAGSFLSKGA